MIERYNQLFNQINELKEERNESDKRSKLLTFEIDKKEKEFKNICDKILNSLLEENKDLFNRLKSY